MTGIVKMFLPGPIRLALSLFSGGKSLIGRAWDWVTASTTHIFATCFAIALIGAMIDHRISHHTIAKLRAMQASDAALIADLRTANETNLKSVDTLTAKIADQNGWIENIAREETARVEAAGKALQAEKGKRASVEAVAASLRAAASTAAPDKQCATPDGVIAAKGDL